ncbi:DM13 domain-containing protein [Nitriliruptor alkaliphilus]|uniref:DM13 domain-containing protein n=1 Tax=Nitriliruptor alkaliphilus TaxID=427918 RepID=UPI00069879FD|nr:DM13 domain-containing protein [Nitriliruptor alkaliphilus]
MSATSQTRPSLWSRVRAHPRRLVVGGVVLVGAVAFVLWWFQPQALLFDRVVDEEFPAVATEPSPEPSPAEAEAGEAGDMGEADDPPPSLEEEGAAEDTVAAEEPTAPRMLSSGRFESRNRYTVTGEATVHELEDGSRTLRLEPFESTNGPDLYVYLTTADHADDDAALAADFVDLGDLRGNIGNQNYPIPDGVDLDVYDTVVIWCERFTVAFGAADLTPRAE